jgi:hypothetical protein
MLKLQPDSKPIKTEIAGESLLKLFALVVFITSIKISSARATFNFGTVLIFFQSKSL